MVLDDLAFPADILHTGGLDAAPVFLLRSGWTAKVSVVTPRSAARRVRREAAAPDVVEVSGVRYELLLIYILCLY